MQDRSVVPPRARGFDQAGRIKFLTIILLAAVVGVGYFAAVWVPLFVDNMSVKKDCEKAVNATWRFKDTEKTRTEFRAIVKGVGMHKVNEGGEMVSEPIINPSDDDLQIQIDQSVQPAVLSIDVTYPRTVKLPLMKGKEHTFWFSAHCEVNLADVKW